MKNSSIKKQNIQAMPSGDRLWTPESIGGDLVYWLQPSGCSGAFTSQSTGKNANAWVDSSFNKYVMRGPDDQTVSTVQALEFQGGPGATAGTGMTFGTLNAKEYPTMSPCGNASMGSFPDDAAPRIDPGTGAFSIIAVGRLNPDDTTVPYSSTRLTIASDGQNSQASSFEFKLLITSQSGVDPSKLELEVECGTKVKKATLETKSGASQIFDIRDFMVSYERDDSASAELFFEAASVATDTGHNADMANTGPRNIFGIVSFVLSGDNIFSADGAVDHKLAEIICFNKEDATTRILCEGYLAHKYGRQDKLPSTHKYRYGPPRI